MAESCTPSLVLSLPGLVPLNANDAFLNRFDASGGLEHRPEWPRVKAELAEMEFTGTPKEIEIGSGGASGRSVRLHCAPVIAGEAGRVRAVMVWVDGLVDDEVTDRAHRVIAAKSKFLAAASHDLRQPFQAMRFFLSVLDDGVRDPDLHRTVGMLGRALASGEQLLDALLDISTLDAGTVEPKPERVAIDEMLRQLEQEFRPQVEGKGLRFNASVRPMVGFTDPVLLERILRNLLSNAVRYTRQGGILLGSRRRGGRLRIEVWDTGYGIPPERQADIFEEFTQLDNPERDRAHGLGLGLAIVRRLTLLLGLPLELHSRLGRGSMFAVSVPMAEPQAAEVEEPEAVPAAVDLSGVAVLVVDDDRMVLSGLTMILEMWGIVVLPAEDMAQVLQRMDEATPTVVLTDLRLRANLSGYEVVDRVRAMLQRQVPAIVLTGETSGDQLAEGRRCGAALLHKPVQAEPLRRAIEDALTRVS
jgi:signal transduction histidine kinase/CheY-like chemotaxis protein